MSSDVVLRIKNRNKKAIELLKNRNGGHGSTQSRVRSPVTERRSAADLSSAFSASLSLTVQDHRHDPFVQPPPPVTLSDPVPTLPYSNNDGVVLDQRVSSGELRSFRFQPPAARYPLPPSVPFLARPVPSQPPSPPVDGDNIPTGMSSNLHLTTTSTSPPWYRFCRPVAPLPSASRMNPQSTAVESGASSLTNEHGVSVTSLSSEASSRSSPECTNIDQEQVNWLASLPLPPLPASSIPVLLYDSLDEEEDLLGAEVLPPPPSRSRSPLPFATANPSPHPLTSVSNILHVPVNFGERLPKWSVLNCHVSDPHLSENRSRTSSRTDHPINPDVPLPSPPAFVSNLPPSNFSRDSLDENVPFQTVNSTNRASPTTPPVPVFASHPNPAGAVLEGFCLIPVAVSGLKRPTVMKREPPDGAEQEMDSSFPEHEAFHESPQNLELPNPSTTKRSAGRPDLSEYSCKKSKSNTLVLSKNSAFLPVRSSRIT